MNVNRKVGTGFERDLCLSLSGCGFWAHNLAQNNQGQPFDVIAARNGVSYPIDCKDCSKNIFKMERIEENQFSAMSLWEETGNGEGWFALRMMNGAVYFLSFTVIRNLFLMKTVLSASEIRQFGSRPDKTVQLDPGDNRKYIMHDLRMWDWPAVDMTRPKDVSERKRICRRISSPVDTLFSVVSAPVFLFVGHGVGQICVKLI